MQAGDPGRRWSPCLGRLVPQRCHAAFLGAPQHRTAAVGVRGTVCHGEPEVWDAAQVGSAETWGKKALFQESELTLLVRPDLSIWEINLRQGLHGGTEGPPLAPMPTPRQPFLFQPLQEGNLDAQGNQCDTANVTLRTVPWSGCAAWVSSAFSPTDQEAHPHVTPGLQLLTFPSANNHRVRLPGPLTPTCEAASSAPWRTCCRSP